MRFWQPISKGLWTIEAQHQPMLGSRAVALSACIGLELFQRSLCPPLSGSVNTVFGLWQSGFDGYIAM